MTAVRIGAAAALLFALCGCALRAHIDLGDLALAWHQGGPALAYGIGHVGIVLH